MGKKNKKNPTRMIQVLYLKFHYKLRNQRTWQSKGQLQVESLGSPHELSSGKLRLCTVISQNRERN